VLVIDDVHELHEVLVDDELDVIPHVLLDVQGSEIEVEHDVQLDDEVEVELVQHDVMQHVEVTTMVEIDDVDVSLIFHEYLLYMHDDEDDEVIQVEVKLNDDDVVDVIEQPDVLLLHMEVDEDELDVQQVIHVV